MATALKFPIRYKILFVLSTVVVAAVGVYLYLASRLFYEDKTVLIYELNQSSVRALSADLLSHVARVHDKLKLVARLAASEEAANSAHSSARKAEPRREIISEVLGDEDELVNVAVLASEGNGQPPERVFAKSWPSYLEGYRKDAAYLDGLREAVPIPFDKVLTEGIWVRNSTLPMENSPPLMTIAAAIDTGSDDGQRRVVYADVRLDRILESFGGSGIARQFIVDSEGKALAGSDQLLVARGVDLSEDPLVKIARASKIRSEVRRYEAEGKSFIGAYFNAGVANLVIISSVETGAAFAAAERLIRKSVIFALLVATTAFLVALFFAHHLTSPIQTMLEATQRIARGDFDVGVRVRTRDELAALAASFNSMTEDLRASRQQIEEYSRDLEKKVQDRTARLEASNIAIKEAQEALVRTTRLASVGEIAGRAAHEVLNPLTNVSTRLEKMQSTRLKPDLADIGLLNEIIGAWSASFRAEGGEGLARSLSAPSTAQTGKTMLEEDLENLAAISMDLKKRAAERATDLEFLLREAGRIGKIVNGMRQLTRVSGNRKALDMNAVLGEVVSTMADVMAKNRIAVELLPGQGKPHVLADHDELIQVFSNLLRNSMQAIQSARQAGTPVGEPARIWLTTERREGRLWVRVCDNGPGIPADHFQHVFEPSFTTKSAEDGTGLGLSIARRFIRALDGEIILEKSEPGRETAFLIDLPEHGSEQKNGRIEGNA